MRYLLSNLILFLFFCSSCASYPKKNNFLVTETLRENINIPYFSDTSKDYVYKADIEAFDKNFGGIFIVKKLGTNHHRIAFTTEMGNKIFDFTFKGDDFNVNYILTELDRKILIGILKKDFKVLITENSSVKSVFKKDADTIYLTNMNNKEHYYFCTNERIHKIVGVGKGKEKIAFLFSEINDNLAKNIQITHLNIPLKIYLKAL